MRPGLLGAAAVVLLAALPLEAQRPAVAAGSVLRSGATDTAAVPGALVVLHRIGQQAQGPIDSVRADAAGRFRFRYTPDTSAVYLFSTNFAGIEYFSDPIKATPARADTGLVLLVSDTTSTGTLLTVSRHIVVSRPDNAGLRQVLEIVVLENPAGLTRISNDTLHAVWGAPLPEGAAGGQASSGDYSPESLVFRHDSVLFFAPVAPGTKQVIFTYGLPANPGTVRLAFADSAGLNLLLEEDRVQPTGGVLGDSGMQAIEGRNFRQWVGTVRAGQVVAIPLGGSATGWVIPALVGAVALALVVVLFRTLRRAPGTAGAPAEATVLEQLARLDRKYAGREADTPAAEWAEYQARRAALKAQLAGQLAAKGPVS